MSEQTTGKISIMRKINLVFRFSYTLPFVLASMCGVLYAIVFNQAMIFNHTPTYVIISIPVATLLMAIFVNFSNDYFDHMSGIDQKLFNQRFQLQKELVNSKILKGIYWEGNQFDTGLVTEKQGRSIIKCLVILILLTSVPIVIYAGFPAIMFGITGLSLAYFYTAPPINLGARGLGEIAVTTSFFMMVLLSFYVISGTITTDILLFSIEVGIIVGLMRVIDSTPTNNIHEEMKEINLSILLGDRGVINLIKTVIVLSYAINIVLCCFDIRNAILFLTMPISIKMIKMIGSKRMVDHWDIRIAPYSFGLSVFTEVFFIVRCLITIYTGVTLL